MKKWRVRVTISGEMAPEVEAETEDEAADIGESEAWSRVLGGDDAIELYVEVEEIEDWS